MAVVSNDPGARLERAYLCLKGLALGDAFGESFLKDPSSAEHAAKHRVLRSAPWRYTHGTVMALAIVEVLRAHNGIEQNELARALANRYRAEPTRGYGPGAHSILDELYRGEDFRWVAPAVFSGGGSMGNGGAMRVAPLGAYFADDLELTAKQAAMSAAVTHAHPDGQAGAIAVAVAAALACRAQGDSRGVKDLLEQVYLYVPRGKTRTALGRARSLSPETSTIDAVRVLGNGARVLCSDTVPLCLWLIQTFAARPWEDGLWQTVAAGGSTNSTSAIVGALLVLLQGRAALPSTWCAAQETLPLA